MDTGTTWSAEMAIVGSGSAWNVPVEIAEPLSIL